MDKPAILTQLTELGNERRAVQREQATLAQESHRIMRNVANLAPKALAVGIPKTEIAELTAISRQQLYAILDED